MLSAAIWKKEKNRNSELRQNIINYMESHFMDSSITASSVSREMKISEKYLSQFMKEQTGETFASLFGEASDR